MSMNRTLVSVGTLNTNCNVTWENEFKNALNNVLTNAADLDYVQSYGLYPVGFITGLVPNYISSSQISISPGNCMATDGQAVINFSSPYTLNILGTGSGGVLQSSFLPGTVSIVNGSYVVTGIGTSFTSSFIPNDIIFLSGVSGINSYQIQTITSSTSLVLTQMVGTGVSGISYARGGSAPGTWYYIYSASNGSTSLAFFSSRNVALGDTLIDYPSGYHVKQLPIAILTDSSGNIVQFVVGNGWPFRPLILMPMTLLLNNGVATTYTAVNLSSRVPPISQLANLFIEIRPNQVISNTTVNLLMRQTGTINPWLTFTASWSGNAPSSKEIFPCSSTGQVDYILTAGSAYYGAYISACGYVVTAL